MVREFRDIKKIHATIQHIRCELEKITHLGQMKFLTLINLTSPFLFKHLVVSTQFTHLTVNRENIKMAEAELDKQSVVYFQHNKYTVAVCQTLH